MSDGFVLPPDRCQHARETQVCLRVVRREAERLAVFPQSLAIPAYRGQYLGDAAVKRFLSRRQSHRSRVAFQRLVILSRAGQQPAKIVQRLDGVRVDPKRRSVMIGRFLEATLAREEVGENNVSLRIFRGQLRGFLILMDGLIDLAKLIE